MNSTQFVWGYIFTVGPLVFALLIWLKAQEAGKKRRQKEDAS